MKITHHEFWMVYDDYVIQDEHLCIAGEYQGSYNPAQQQELPGEITKVQAGNTEALLQFARTYGMLGYQFLYRPNRDEKPPRHNGEPLPWIWAHINAIKLCLELQQCCCEQREAWVIEACLDKHHTQRRWQDTNTTYEIPIAIKGHLDVMRLMRQRQESIYDFAQKIRHEIIQRNIEALTYELRRLDGKAPPVLEFTGLIEVVYWHLAEMEQKQKPVKQCEECGALFIVQHRKQQYCPHPDPLKESPCGANARQKKRRQAQRVSTP